MESEIAPRRSRVNGTSRYCAVRGSGGFSRLLRVAVLFNPTGEP